MTAFELLAELRSAGCEPTAKGGRIGFAAPVPTRLVPYLRLLSSGVFVILAQRLWIVIDGNGRGVGAGEFGSLSPRELLPYSASLLTCTGSDWAGWTRISKQQRAELPECFARPAKTAAA